jgi:hypothetical protein
MPKFKYLHREEGQAYVCFDLTGEYRVHHDGPSGAIRYVIEESDPREEAAEGTVICDINHGGGGDNLRETGLPMHQRFYLQRGDEVMVAANGDLAILKQTPPVVPNQGSA